MYNNNKLAASSSNSSQKLPNKVFLPDDRRKIQDTTSYPNSAIVLFLKDGDVYCTGALVSESTVVTAAHCVVEKDGKTITTGISFCPGAYAKKRISKPGFGSSDEENPPRFPGWGSSSIPGDGHTPPTDSDGSSGSHVFSKYYFPYGCSSATWFLWDTATYKPKGEKGISPKGDFALVKLDNPLGRDTGYFGYSELPLGASNVSVRLTGYPAEPPRNDAPGNQWTTTGYIQSVSGEYAYHELDATGGQSGSPLYDNDNRIRAVLKGDNGVFNWAPRITPQRAAWIKKYAREGGW